MARALKVYRTPIGFHDAYVAASSQTAALKAWGTEHNLFARGAAEIVTDPALTAAPLAEPGRVIKLLRGSAEEQMAAASVSPSEEPSSPGKPEARVRRIIPRPGRSALDQAEQALEAEEASHAAEADALARQISALEKQRRAQEVAHAAKLAQLQQARDKAREAYEAAMDRWRRDAS
jgi:hypothetical protein